MANAKTMKAVVFEGPYKVSVQNRPIPTCSLHQVIFIDDHTGLHILVQDATDIIIKVQATALCGS